MSIHPILYSGQMIRAKLEGRKWQTRRVIAPKGQRATFSLFAGNWTDDYVLHPENEEWRMRDVRFKAGDLLWVRETLRYDWPARAWQYDADKADLETTRHFTLETPTPERWSLGFCPSIHMPRWASRLTDKVTGVKVERLQAISEDDARAEGCIKLKASGRAVEYPGAQYLGQAWPNCRSWYRHLWDSINGKKPGHAWADNPWVVAVTFETIRQNVMEIANAD